MKMVEAAVGEEVPKLVVAAMRAVSYDGDDDGVDGGDDGDGFLLRPKEPFPSVTLTFSDLVRVARLMNKQTNIINIHSYVHKQLLSLPSLFMDDSKHFLSLHALH